jgi:hypothetical protein
MHNFVEKHNSNEIKDDPNKGEVFTVHGWEDLQIFQFSPT